MFEYVLLSGLGLFIVFCIVMIVKTSKKPKIKPVCRENFKPTTGSYAHFSGLPVPAGAMCDLSLTESGLSIWCSVGGTYELALEKIARISTMTETEEQIQKQFVASTGGAVAGALIAGIPGALIGGRVKEKKSKQTIYKNYLVVSYTKDDALAYLVFSLNGTPMETSELTYNFACLTVGRKTSEAVQL